MLYYKAVALYHNIWFFSMLAVMPGANLGEFGTRVL